MKNRDIFLLLAIGFASTSAYLVFRIVLDESQHPITFELFAALIGVILTITLTSILLKRQTAADLRKDENIKFLDLKMKIYLELIDQIHDIFTKKDILEEDVIEIRLLNQRLTFVASQEVLIKFSGFSALFAKLARQNGISNDDMDELLAELSILSVSIRQDLLASNLPSEDNLDEIRKRVLQSNQNLDIE